MIPEKGSVGASRRSCSTFSRGLALIGEGEVEYQGKIVRADFAIHQIKKTPAKLGPKDGLALINGTSVMLALGSLAVTECTRLMKLADIVSCLTLDAVRGTAAAFDIRISQLKPQPGQLAVSENCF